MFKIESLLSDLCTLSEAEKPDRLIADAFWNNAGKPALYELVDDDPSLRTHWAFFWETPKNPLRYNIFIFGCILHEETPEKLYQLTIKQLQKLVDKKPKRKEIH